MTPNDPIEAINEALKEDGRSKKWLSKKTEIPYPTITAYLSKSLFAPWPKIVAMMHYVKLDPDFFDKTYSLSNKHTA